VAILSGRCRHRDEYEPAWRDAHWQCSESADVPNFFLPSGNRTSAERGTAYSPAAGVNEALASFAGVDRAHLERLQILSGLNASGSVDPVDLARASGKWCGMVRTTPWR
jgi:hypothetical protein